MNLSSLGTPCIEVVQRCLKLPYCEYQRNRREWFVALIREVLASNPFPVIILAEVCSAGLRKSRATKFCTVAANIFSTIVAGVFFLTHKNVYCFTCTKQKASDNSEAGRSFQNFGSSVWKLLHVALLSLEFGGGM